MVIQEKIKIKLDEIEPHHSSLSAQLLGVIGDPKLEFDQISDINLTSIYHLSRQLNDLKNQKKIIFHSLTHYNEHLNRLVSEINRHNLINHNGHCVLISNDFFYKNHFQHTDNVVYFDPIRFYYSHFFQGRRPLSLCWMQHNADHAVYWPKITESELVQCYKTKIFLSPCRLYLDQNRTHYRHRLFLKLYQFKDLGFMSGPGRIENPGVIENLINWNGTSDILVPETYDLNEHKKIPNFGGIPPNRQYYLQSFISIYGETLETGYYTAPTEKSYIPLWRGHLIFPFSCVSTIQALRLSGFQFPDKYIDYSYDQIENDEERWHCYENELERLLNLSMDQWGEIWSNTIDIRLANQILLMQPQEYLNVQKLVNILE
jgi:hypothetical protein